MAQVKRQFSKRELERTASPDDCSQIDVSTNDSTNVNVSPQLESDGQSRINPRHDHYLIIRPNDDNKTAESGQLTSADVMDEFVAGLVRRQQKHDGTGEAKEFRFELAEDIMQAIVGAAGMLFNGQK